MNKDPELTFKEFKERSNNFHLYFVDLWNNHYRKKPHFLRFKKENTQLEEKLTKDFTPEWRKFQEFKVDGRDIIARYGERLYQAYRLMRKYIKRDETLFV